MTDWQNVLGKLYPVFITAETTGVNSDDILSAVSVATLDCPDPSLHVFEVDSAKASQAAQFLGMTVEQYNDVVKEDRSAIPDFVVAIEDWAIKQGLDVVLATYNPKFQVRYLSQLDPTLFAATPSINLVQLAWCVANTAEDAIYCDSLQSLIEAVDALTHAVKVGSYKAILADWGLPITVDPRSKPEALLKLWQALLKWTPGCERRELSQ